jgi:hypothetical protein
MCLIYSVVDKSDHMMDRLPLVIAVTGHRDLVTSEIPGIRASVGEFLDDLAARYPQRELTVVSPLAEGADQLVARIAVDREIALLTVLPMARELYIEDFSSSETLDEFEALLSHSVDVIELPVAKLGPEREMQYAQAGVFISAHCHILLALWDGKQGDKLGGTAQVVRFHHDDTMPGYTPKTVRTQQMLVDDESDLVYHIVCSRDRSDGEPLAGLSPLAASWYSNNETQPRSQSLPSEHERVFHRSAEFSHDANRFSRRIEKEKFSLLDGETEIPRGLGNIDNLFGIADWLAVHYQRRTVLILRIAHLLAFLMGFMFILYSDLDTQQGFLYAFLVSFLAAAGLQYLAKHRGWHRKYLDYRTLAEGLRVQFYWAAAGVSNENLSKFSHDNFLQTQDPELGWIRNVMRVAGIRCDAAPEPSPEGLAFALRQWIGTASTGQLGYFRNKAELRVRRHRLTERLGQFSLLTSAAVVTAFLVMGTSIPEKFSDPLVVLMGTTLLLFAVRHGYAYSTAEKELIRQYEFMLRIFTNARRRLNNAEDENEQRQVLMALGGSALDEHAQWILMHRERSVDQGEIWLMGSGS